VWPQTDDLTYKGAPLGASITEYKSKLPDQECDDKYGSCSYLRDTCVRAAIRGKMIAEEVTEGISACDKRNSFGGVTVDFAHANFREGKLVEISLTINERSFDALTGAVTERLGKPTKVIDSAIQTRGGATLQNREMIWERPSMVLTVERYGSTIEKGSAILTTPQERDRRIAEREAAKKKGAKDF
jgi:hypothetical protein